MKRFYFASVCEPHPIPQKAGKTIQMYRFGLPAFNTTPAAEGVIGNPVQQSSTPISATVEEYSDFMSSSSLLDETDINDTVYQMVDDLSYRAAGSTDTIIRQEIDSNTGSLVPTLGNNFSALDVRAQKANLEAIDVRPFDDGSFRGVIHPYIIYDLTADNTAGGFIDCMKYQHGTELLNGEIGMVGQTRFMSSTNVSSTGTSPAVLYNTYMFGKGSMGIVDLEGKGPDRIEDPMAQKFRTSIVKGGPSPSDPVGEIGTYVSYRFVFTAKTLDGNRIKIIQCDASLV